MAAHEAPPSLGFSRQEQWSGLPFPSAMRESESEVAHCLGIIWNSLKHKEGRREGTRRRKGGKKEIKEREKEEGEKGVEFGKT